MQSGRSWRGSRSWAGVMTDTFLPPHITYNLRHWNPPLCVSLIGIDMILAVPPPPLTSVRLFTPKSRSCKHAYAVTLAQKAQSTPTSPSASVFPPRALAARSRTPSPPAQGNFCASRAIVPTGRYSTSSVRISFSVSTPHVLGCRGRSFIHIRRCFFSIIIIPVF